MIFSSLEFVCVFLPIVFGLYCVLPSIKLKNALLIVASLLFYAYGEPLYVFLMIISAFFNYVTARGIASNPKTKKIFLIAGVVLNLGILAVFKYADFFVETCNSLLGVKLSKPGIILPIGISFFTFQAMSYVIDVYQGKVEAQKSFWKILLYISFFPQLIAGPIVKYRDINEAIGKRSMDVAEVAKGLRRFICGLGKKVLIANTMGLVADHVFTAAASNVNIVVAWIGAVSYLLQIYYDFSGYSDMAIGLGRMFGFHFKENFQYPYGADSIQEFWRRWHISLSTWFKEYLYIPLGGNRKGMARTCFNRMLVFFFTGLWHGANWTFVVWGLWHGLFLLFETYLPVVKRLPKIVARIYTLLVVCVGFVMFRADSLGDGLFMIKQMFTGFTFNAQCTSFALQQLTPWFVVMAVLGMIGAAPVQKLVERIRRAAEAAEPSAGRRKLQTALYMVSVLLLGWCIIRLSGSTYNPFIYFRF
ncbi:MAG: MBOAT family protein [Lachnospiraceae bacterium]|nr:MBOAT family protein [Lachnospiraceae bacterium]